MRDTGTADQTPSTRAIRKRVSTIVLWALQALLAIMFAMAGLAKVFGDPAMVEMFATIGIGQWFRYAVGALEIAGAVGVLVPRLSGLAALGLVCLMAGATLTNFIVLGASPLLPLVLLAASALVAWVRGQRTSVIFDISVFLDEFVTASGVRPEELLGDGGQRLHRWACLRGSLRRASVVSFEAADGGRTKMTVCEYGYTTD